MKVRYRHLLESKAPVAGIAAGLIVIALLALASFSNISEFKDHTGWVDHTHKVQFELEQTVFLVTDAQAASDFFAIGGNPEFLAAYEDAHRSLPEKLADLTALLADNPVQLQDITRLREDIQQIMAMQERTVSLRRVNGSAAPALAYTARGSARLALDGVRHQVTLMQGREADLLVAREHEVVIDASNTKKLIVFGTTAAFVVFGAAFWLLSREVYQRKRADRLLVQANSELSHHAKQLEQAMNELESFSYSISHDLRIPLRAIAGYASMLAEDYAEKLDAEGQRLLSVIRENSKRMGALIDDLLSFSKFGRQAISSDDIDMHALVENVVAEMPQREHSPNTKVILEQLTNAWGDRTLLKQVWINLVSNALKYSSKKESPEIRISAVRDADETVYAVRDNGVGFDMQYANKLFGVFQRLHNADEFPGTGVGLAIVHRIVQRHGGRVWAEGALNQGATFFFALPNKG